MFNDPNAIKIDTYMHTTHIRKSIETHVTKTSTSRQKFQTHS